MIQPFDGGRFDKLFEDVFQPAVAEAGLEPYRIDRDPSVSIPVEQIEAGIRGARVCFVDLTTDNPNVWFELGYAISNNKDLCLVCAKERTKYPFDIQHRSIISYNSESPRDFVELGNKIRSRVQALLIKQTTMDEVSLPTFSKPRAGLQGHELSCLATIASEVSGLEAEITNYQLKREMERVGYNSLATQISLRSLLRQNYITMRSALDHDDDPYELYAMTSDGWDWISENSGSLNLASSTNSSHSRRGSREIDDDIPF